MTENQLKRTALYDAHVSLGGKIIAFSGWELPLYYRGILEEHEAVRTAAGLFDVSHMGECILQGKDAERFVNFLITNDASALADGQIAYSLLCYEDGGIVDDILVYKYNREHFLLVVNAANIDKDIQWIQSQKRNYQVEITPVSHQWSQLALQGPKAEAILQKLTDFPLSTLTFFYFKAAVPIAKLPCLLSRSGYTGEDGFEIYMKNEDVPQIFAQLLEAGKDEGLQPAGLGCRDTLRFEASLPLYGNEISESISPLEAGLGMFVKLHKPDFIGKSALEAQKSAGLRRKIVGFEMLDKAIPRHGYPVQKDGEPIGVVTTGYQSPTLKKNIGLALLASEHAAPGSRFEIVVRNKSYAAHVISKNFLNKNYKK